MTKKIYVSERITNIAQLEETINDCYILAQLIQKESPDNPNSLLLVEKLKTAVDFEFRIERRKTDYCE